MSAIPPTSSVKNYSTKNTNSVGSSIEQKTKDILAVHICATSSENLDKIDAFIVEFRSYLWCPDPLDTPTTYPEDYSIKSPENLDSIGILLSQFPPPPTDLTWHKPKTHLKNYSAKRSLDDLDIKPLPGPCIFSLPPDDTTHHVPASEEDKRDNDSCATNPNKKGAPPFRVPVKKKIFQPSHFLTVVSSGSRRATKSLAALVLKTTRRPGPIPTADLPASGQYDAAGQNEVLEEDNRTPENFLPPSPMRHEFSPCSSILSFDYLDNTEFPRPYRGIDSDSILSVGSSYRIGRPQRLRPWKSLSKALPLSSKSTPLVLKRPSRKTSDVRISTALSNSGSSSRSSRTSLTYLTSRESFSSSNQSQSDDGPPTAAACMSAGEDKSAQRRKRYAQIDNFR